MKPLTKMRKKLEVALAIPDNTAYLSVLSASNPVLFDKAMAQIKKWERTGTAKERKAEYKRKKYLEYKNSISVNS